MAIHGTVHQVHDLRTRIGGKVDLSDHGLALAGRHIEAGRLLTDSVCNIQNRCTLQQLTCRLLAVAWKWIWIRMTW